ncbi:pali-domain-containing protein [Westerdykella ornata]|uniref:Pali-domain-containing protein n=1 Tax=Westerdykella ornata TaxID=318751 RepID=A0A6A6JC05_WESOR|nr:pali-domain-containing protein [Westerdykella ornata]KAF2273703.1 pali-domain-containing protein [Westerdykella ornata]
MLRPATPLSILFFTAFVLLLLSTLSTPIIRGIPLATFRGVNFGVLGYCRGSDCHGPMINYDTDDLFPDGPDSDFSLPAAARHSLSTILIVHPVAALLTLICFSLAVAAHFHAPAHSPRYLLALLILTFPTLLVSLLAFLVDILLFVPHLAWGGWIVLGATILIVASGVVTCAMRRTLVSRKARKRRIAENAEMNGQNYQASRAAVTAQRDTFPRAESPPPLSGETVTFANDKMPEYAAYEMHKTQSQDDTTPLNARNPSLRTNSSNGREGSDRSYVSRAPSGRGRQPVDQYGNPIPPLPSESFVMQNGPHIATPPNRGGPQMGGRGRGGYPPRGGYGPPRGGYGPPRGGYGPRGGMRGPPPPGWNGNGRGGMRPGPGPGGRGGPPPPGYNNGYYAQQGVPNRREPSPYGAPRGMSPPGPRESPNGIGQAVQMDSQNGTVAPPPTQNLNYGLRESDDDVQGMLALQQGGFPAQELPRRNSGPMSPTSDYSQDDAQYVPARTNWQNPNNPSGQTPPTTSGSNARGLSPIQDSPVELPAQSSVVGARTSGYFEDVEPRFAEPVGPPAGPLPSSLMPGGFSASAPNLPNSSLGTGDPGLLRNPSYDDIPEGARSPRSPAASDTSHFTSVSQRGINPNWRPPPPGMGDPALPGQYPPYGRRPIRKEDVILEANAANPDFAVPGAEFGRGRGRGRGKGGRGGPVAPATMNNMGMGTAGRYPGADAI